jgi:hypothetical protein
MRATERKALELAVAVLDLVLCDARFGDCAVHDEIATGEDIARVQEAADELRTLLAFDGADRRAPWPVELYAAALCLNCGEPPAPGERYCEPCARGLDRLEHDHP